MFTFLVSLAVLPLDSVTGTFNERAGFGLIGGIFSLVVLVPSITLGVRRLHDINRSGWWLLMIVFSWTIIPALILLFWAIKPGTYGKNQYGTDPRQPVELAVSPQLHS